VAALGIRNADLTLFQLYFGFRVRFRAVAFISRFYNVFVFVLPLGNVPVPFVIVVILASRIGRAARRGEKRR
jgi:hypothetical protein